MPLYKKGDKFLVVEKNPLNVEQCDKGKFIFRETTHDKQ
jgi:hypothetical protein